MKAAILRCLSDVFQINSSLTDGDMFLPRQCLWWMCLVNLRLLRLFTQLQFTLLFLTVAKIRFKCELFTS